MEAMELMEHSHLDAFDGSVADATDYVQRLELPLQYTTSVLLLLLLRLTAVRYAITWLLGPTQPHALRSIRRRAQHWIWLASLTSCVFVLSSELLTQKEKCEAPSGSWMLQAYWGARVDPKCSSGASTTKGLITFETSLASAISSMYGYSYASGIITAMLCEPVIAAVGRNMVRELTPVTGLQQARVAAAFGLPLLLGLYMQAVATVGYCECSPSAANPSTCTAGRSAVAWWPMADSPAPATAADCAPRLRKLRGFHASSDRQVLPTG